MKCGRAFHDWVPLRVDMGPRIEGSFVCCVCGAECPEEEAKRLESLIQREIVRCA